MVERLMAGISHLVPSWAMACGLALALHGGEQPVAAPGPASPQPAVAAVAADARVSVALSATPATVNVGDSLAVTVTYRWPRGWTVQAPGGEPDPATDFAHAYVTDLPPARRTSAGDEERRVFHLTLAATTSGSWQLPQPTLTVTGPGGPVTATATPVIITVGTEDKPPQLPAARAAWTRAQEPGDGAMAWWALVCALVALAGIGALLLNRRRRELILPTPWERFIDGWQAASTAADGKEAGARLSLALRRWLGELYQFDGPGSTSREMLAALRESLADDERRRLGQLLDQLDGLRWAADDLPPSAVRPLIADGRAWADALKHRRDVETEERAKAGAAAAPAGKPA